MATPINPIIILSSAIDEIRLDTHSVPINNKIVSQIEQIIDFIKW